MAWLELSFDPGRTLMDRDKIAKLQDAMNKDLESADYIYAEAKALVLIANLLVEETKSGGAFNPRGWVGGAR